MEILSSESYQGAQPTKEKNSKVWQKLAHQVLQEIPESADQKNLSWACQCGTENLLDMKLVRPNLHRHIQPLPFPTTSEF